MTSKPGERQTPVGLWKVGMRYSKAQNGRILVGFHPSRLAELAFSAFSSSSGLIPSSSISTAIPQECQFSTSHYKERWKSHLCYHSIQHCCLLPWQHTKLYRAIHFTLCYSTTELGPQEFVHAGNSIDRLIMDGCLLQPKGNVTVQTEQTNLVAISSGGHSSATLVQGNRWDSQWMPDPPMRRRD